MSTIPTRPRFIEEAVAVVLPDRVVLDGLAEARLLSGRFAVSVLPKLLPLMDGSRTLTQLKDSFPELTLQNLEQFVSILSEKGIIPEQPRPDLGQADDTTNTLGFFGRMAGFTGANSCGDEAWARFCQAPVLVIAHPSALEEAAELCSLLRRTGASTADCIHGRELFSRDAYAGMDSGVIVSLSLCENRNWHASVDDWCYRKGNSWLKAVFEVASGHADVGPWFKPQITGCYRCFADTQLPPVTNVSSTGIE